MAEITLKYEEGYEVRCPLCGTAESKSPVRYPDTQAPGESWIQCVKCGTSYKPPKWQAAGGGVKGNAPTVDAVEVVRCKDCKHYDLGVCLKIYSNGNAHPEAWQPRRPEDFCSYGDRKGKNETERT